MYRQSVPINGREQSFLRWGSKLENTVVVLHGYGLEALNYRGLGKQLHGRQLPKTDATILILDLPGFGESQTVKGEMSDTVATLLDQLGIREATFIAHSMGGLVGIELFHKRPDLVKKIIFFASAGLRQKRNPLKWVWLTFANQLVNARSGKTDPESNWTGWFRVIWKGVLHPLWYLKTFFWTTRADYVAPLRSLRGKAFVIWGAEDLYFPDPVPRQFCRDLQVNPTIIPGWGHDGIFLYPEEFVDQVSRLI